MSAPVPPSTSLVLAPGTAPLGWSPLVVALALFAIALWLVEAGTGERAEQERLPTSATPATAIQPVGPLTPAPPTTTVSLILGDDGFVTFNGRRFPLQELPGQITQLAASPPPPGVRITAPRQLALPVLVEVMAALKAAGISQTSLRLVDTP
jgi:biopolymer transport protein ExbD